MFSKYHTVCFYALAGLTLAVAQVQSCLDTGILLTPGSSSRSVSQITGSSCSAALTYPNQPAIAFGSFKPSSCGGDITIQEISLASDTPLGSAILTVTCQVGQDIASSCSLVTVDGTTPSQRFRRQTSSMNQIQFSCGSTQREELTQVQSLQNGKCLAASTADMSSALLSMAPISSAINAATAAQLPTANPNPTEGSMVPTAQPPTANPSPTKGSMAPAAQPPTAAPSPSEGSMASTSQPPTANPSPSEGSMASTSQPPTANPSPTEGSMAPTVNVQPMTLTSAITVGTTMLTAMATSTTKV